MNIRTSILFAFILLLGGCGSPSIHTISDTAYGDGTSDTLNDDSIYNEQTIKYYDSVFNEIDNYALIHVSDWDTFKITNAYADTVELYLLHTSMTAKKLCHTLLGDDGLKESKLYTEQYYFDNEGRLIGNKINFDSVSDFLVFNTPYNVISYSKGNSITINPIDTVTKYSKQAIIAKYVASYMQFFKDIKYTNLEANVNSMQTLRSFDAIDLKDAPGIHANTIERLPYNSHMVYLYATTQPDTINDNVWVWYKVVADDKHIGWVFGYPRYVDDLNDENWGD